MELKHITREEWVAALRSGKYQRAEGSLKKTNRNGEDCFCCLGVACDLAGVGWELISPSSRCTSTFAVRANEGKPYPLLGLFVDLGLKDTDACELAAHNDRGDSFLAIANEIEALPVRVVDPDWLGRWFPYEVKMNAKAEG